MATTQPVKTLSFDWKQRVDDLSPDQDAFGPDVATATMIIEVDAGEIWNVIAEVLGYPYLDTGESPNSPARLRRVLPWNCPKYPWLYAERIASIRGDKFLGKAGGPALGGPSALYEKEVLTIVFTPPRFRVLTDAQTDALGGEWLRFVERYPRPGVDTLQVEKGAMAFTAGPFVGSNPSQRIVRSVGKRDLEWVWRQVPKDFITSPTTGREDNILTALANPVNEQDFDGHPAGTLLLTEASVDPETPAVQPIFLNPSDPTDPNRTYTVTLRFAEFDPPRDPGVGYPADYTGRGHCLLPAPQLANQYFYPATSVAVGGAGGGQPLYTASDFANIFKRPA